MLVSIAGSSLRNAAYILQAPLDFISAGFFTSSRKWIRVSCHNVTSTQNL